MVSFNIQQFNVHDSPFHADSIHHIEFDFYGTRVATVSSDKTVCIWDRDRSANTWKKSASWKKHGGAVWKVRFAHPEFGQVLATCSYDNTIQIFDRDASDLTDFTSRSNFNLSGSTDTSDGWISRAILRQSAAGILDIQFAPHYLGLLLAACTSNGRVVIYEAEDIMALDNWTVVLECEICSYRLSSLSWSMNRYSSPYIVVSSDDLNTPSNEKVYIFKVNINSGLTKSDVHGKERFDFPDQVSNVAFGPSAGLTYHRLAIAVGSKLYIYHLHVSVDEGGTPSNRNFSGNGIITKLNGVLEDGLSQIVRISWNILGDLISAVCADGLVKIWKYGYANKWILISSISPQSGCD